MNFSEIWVFPGVLQGLKFYLTASNPALLVKCGWSRAVDRRSPLHLHTKALQEELSPAQHLQGGWDTKEIFLIPWFCQNHLGWEFCI